MSKDYFVILLNTALESVFVLWILNKLNGTFVQMLDVIHVASSFIWFVLNNKTKYFQSTVDIHQ